MIPKILRNSIGIDRKTGAVTIFLVANAFVWYFYSYSWLEKAINTARLSDAMVTMFGINFGALAASAILSVLLARKIKNKLNYIIIWMLSGVLISLSPLVMGFSTYASLAILSAIFGFYFGSGMPLCLDYFASHSATENRARLSGIAFFLTGVSFVLLSGVQITDVALGAIILSAWRGVGLLTVVGLRPKRTSLRTQVSFGSVIKNRSFLLYFVPWCLFMMVNLMMTPLITKLFGDLLPSDLIETATLVNNGIVFAVALISGFLADYAGRKRLTVSGFALLGLGYAGIGLFPGNLGGYWFYMIADGFTWGIFYTVFLTTIWGDLAQESSSEKYYALGSMPFLLSVFVRLSLGAYIVSLVPNYGFFSYASVFLFLAVLPLIYAPETLSEKVMKDRELKNYIEKARKEASKAQGKELEEPFCEIQISESHFSSMSDEGVMVDIVGEEFGVQEDLAEKMSRIISKYFKRNHVIPVKVEERIIPVEVEGGAEKQVFQVAFDPEAEAERLAEKYY
jgi:MFS family permease